MGFNLQSEGNNILRRIKEATFFPYMTGNLKFNATIGVLIDPNTYLIRFDSTVAPYIQYLEEGTGPHDIPGAFGKPLPFGIGGRFDGKFHPGSTKHKGFISHDCVHEIINYITTKYRGSIVEVIG